MMCWSMGIEVGEILVNEYIFMELEWINDNGWV